MNFYVTDTHALFWYLINSPLLGAGASGAFDEADNGQAFDIYSGYSARGAIFPK